MRAAPGRFDFAVIGDQQYDAESDAQFPRLMADIDRSAVEFVVHLGDFKPGTTQRCDDQLFESRRRQFDASRHPFIYTPGDNDWTDCHNPKAGGFVPGASTGFSRGPPLAAKRGSFPDGAHRWQQQQPGPHAGRRCGVSRPYGGEHCVVARVLRGGEERNAAAVAIFTQANPRFERSFPKGRVNSLQIGPSPTTPSGYADFLPELEKEVVGYGKPVLFLHGDTHYFRVDKPLFRSGAFGGGDRGRQVESFTRLEVHGFPEAHWVRVAVDPRDPSVFSLKEEIVDANRFRPK